METFPVQAFVAAASPLVGSAIAAGANRFAAGASWGLAPSACMACGRRLRWFEIVPVASWLALRGRCRGCGARISASYPIVEAAAGAIAAWAWFSVPDGVFAATCVLGWLLLALGVIDTQTRRLPNILTGSLALCGLAAAVVFDRAQLMDHVIGGVAGYGLLVAVELAYRRLRGADGLGRGDAKLLGALGLWTGWQGLPTILLYGAAGAIGWMLIAAIVQRRRLDGKASLAFGPFLAAGGWLVWLYGALEAV